MGKAVSYRMAAARVVAVLASLVWASFAGATPFTTTVPGTAIVLPNGYPEAGGVAIVMEGVNGNLYYQFSDPTGAFIGFQNSGQPSRFRGNPFTINDPISLDCGYSNCSTYFGGGLARVYIRFSAYDGDTQPGGFDQNDISLILNGYNVGSWSGMTTEITNDAGTQSFGFATGFGNNTFNTGWFSSSNAALLSNILSTGQTVTQVFDRDPNDNYWDFTRGPSLGNNNIVTVAPGYTLEKTAPTTSFTGPDESVVFSYKIDNIGSVPIRDLSVFDDQIGPVSCADTVILDRPRGAPRPDSTTCTATYVTTQEDVDRGFVTNIANAEGTPDSGTLGVLRDDWTLTGPAQNPVLFFDKASSAGTFGAAGTPVPYSFTLRNDGNVTLTNLSVTDPRLPGLSCPVPDLAPGEDFVCSGNYTVTQADVDAVAANPGYTIDNTATARATAPDGTRLTETDSVSLSGDTPTVSFSFEKVALTTDYDAVGDILQYEFRITNTGTVTFPSAPAITDDLTGAPSCPAGAIAPGGSVVCTASYAVDQDDLDAGEVPNSATAQISVGALSDSQSDSATVPAIRSTGLTLDKRLASGAPTSYAATGVALTYDYVLTNTGTVSLIAPAVTDDKVTVTCAATEIAPGASITCTSDAHVTDQDDLDAGEVVNVATASATGKGPAAEAVTSNTDTVTVPASQRPALALNKTAPSVDAAGFQVGETITYTYQVTNTGNVTLTEALTGVTQISIDDDKIGTFSCEALPLAVGDSVTCTEDYTLTVADILAQSVVNTATASAGPVVSPEDSAQVSPALNPEISLVKSADTASVSGTGDTITYRFLVTNTGDTQIIALFQPITINDPALDSFDCSAQPATLDPGASFSCTGVRSGITQAELDAGQVTNTATASFPYTVGGTPNTFRSDSSSVSVPVAAAPALVFTKDGPAQFGAVGTAITYTFTAQNTGNVTLETVTVSDPRLPGLSCVLTDIAPGASDSCTAPYTIRQADLDAERIDNTATAVAVPAQGPQQTETDTHTALVDPAAATKSLSLGKVADRASFTSVGEVITYTFNVENTGTQTLTSVTVTDALDAGYSCLIPTIAPGVTNSTCTYRHTVTQDDVDAGQVVNLGSAQNADVGPVTDGTTVTGPARVASFTFDKRAPASFSAAGEVVDFTFALTNTGNVTLTNVTVNDPFFGSPVNCVVPTLAPGATDVTCTASYTIGQPDIDAGEITNSATADADAPAGVAPPPQASDSVTVEGPAETAAVTIEKTSADGLYTSATDTEVFTFTVTNSGNVTLTDLRVQDPDLGLDCFLDDLLPGGSTTSCTGGAPLIATKSLDQGDVDAGSYTNIASVSGVSAGQGTAVSDTDSETLTGPVQAPAISLAKSSTLVGPMDTVRQVVPFEFVVTNTGNITLTSDITISDPMIPQITCPTFPAGGVAPGGTYTCTGSYRVTQADLDAGQIDNTATASITQAVIPQNLGDPASVTATDTATETVLADQNPALRLVKRVKSGSAASFDSVGDVVTFEYVVTNTGNVTTTAAITIDDDKFADTLTCTAAPLAPGASVTCEQDWTAVQDDIDAGEVTNIATADTDFGGTPVASAPRSVTVNAVQTPSLAVEKTFVSTSNPGLFVQGDLLTYSIVVTNDGNVTVDAPITLTDNLAAPSCPAVPGGALAPGDTLTCSATHTVTVEDLQLGSSTNVVYATGSFDGAPVVSPSDNAIYPVDARPALELLKEALPTNVPFDAVGQEITYRFTVRNTGNVALTEAITVQDDVMGALPCRPASAFVPYYPDPGNTAITDANGEFVCEFPYSIDQDDLDRGSVTNNASATTVYAPASPNPVNVVSPRATETIVADETEVLTVAKTMTTVLTDGVARVGDVLTYRITATNDGNQTLSAVAIEDSLVPELSCSVGGNPAGTNVILLPTEALLCTGTYTVTQADIDAQTLLNTADATATDPQGGTITGSDTHSQPLVAPVSSIQTVKAITPDPAGGTAFTDPGQPLTFTITVINDGNVTQASTTITDSLPVTPASCTIGELAPGESDSSCVFTYEVTQADIDGGSSDGSTTYAGFTNVATAVATPVNPALPEATDDGEVFVRGPDLDPRFTLVKESATTRITAAGQVVPYRFTIANIGNVTLTEAPEITDDKIGTFICDGLPAGGIAPSEFYTCTRDYTVTQADMDAGEVTNTATATSTEVPDPATDALTIEAQQSPALTLAKSADVTADLVAGQTITYTYTVTNTGNVTLDDVAVTDVHTSASGETDLTVGGDTLLTDVNEIGTSTDADADNGTWSVLAPGDVVTFTAQYTVTQADLDAQEPLTNIATATGSGPLDSGPATDTATESVSPILKAPVLVLTKTADATALTDPAVIGQEIVFTLTVRNAGNVTLTAPVLTDTLTDADGASLTLTQAPIYDSGDDGNDAFDVGETWTYTARFALDQQALDAGGVENTFSATADDPQGDPLSEDLPDAVVVPIAQAPALAVVKTSSLNDGGDGRADVGDVIIYTYVVSNTGNVSLLNAGVTETSFTGTGTQPVPAYASGGADLDTDGATDDIAVGDTITFTATYALTQADIDAGSVTNQATASAADPQGDPASDLSGSATDNDDPTRTAITNAPALVVTKTADSSALTDPVQLGQEIAFTIAVENTGNVTLNAPVLTDTLTDAEGASLTLTQAPTYDSGDDGNDAFDVGETWVYTARFAVDQQALDAGGVENTVTADADDGLGGSATDTIDAPVVVPVAQAPALAVVKTSSLNDGGDGRADEGDVITYTYVVTNTGNVSLLNAGVTETSFTGTGTLPVPAYASGGADLDTDGATDDIAVGGTITFTASYALTQADIDAGSVTNQATASAADPQGDPASDLSGSATGNDDPIETAIPNAPALEVVKSAEAFLSTPAQPGDRVAYTITVANTGNVTLAAPTLTDTLTTAEGRAQVLSAAPSLTGGDDGNGTLDVGEVWTYSAEAVVTQQAIDDGGLSNTVLAETTAPGDVPVLDRSDDGSDPAGGDTPTATPITGAPDIAVVKSAALDPGPDGVASVGDLITYTYAVTNTGNATLFDAGVTETGFGGAGVLPVPTLASGGADLDGNGDGPDIAVGAAPAVFTATYALTQADIDAGDVQNQATARAFAPDGSPVEDLSGADAGDDTPTLTDLPGAPGIEVVKTAITTGVGDPAAVGDTVTFVIAVENTGNVSLSSVALSEDFRRRDGTPLSLTPVLTAGDGGTPDVLDVGETWEYRASHALTQEDLDAGGLQNQVTATAQSPLDGPVSDLSDDGDDADGDTTGDATTVNVPGRPAITLAKALDPASPDPFAAEGDVLTYTFTVTNTGNITITEPVSVSDPLLAGQGRAITCAAPPLAPGASLLCTGDYAVTQADLDAGEVVNEASASITQPVLPANPGDPTEVTAEAESNGVTVPGEQTPALTIAKTLSDASATSFDAVGDTLSYDFTVTNSGNVTLAGPFTVDDDRIGEGLACGSDALAPGQSVTCTHVYTITQDDLNDGLVTNTATGNAVYDGTPVVSDPDSVTVTGVQSPEITLAKALVSATPDTFDTGTVLAYEFTVSNPGNVSLSGPITIDDSLVDTVSCPVLTDDLLQPGETVVCTAEYVIEEADLALGAVTNLASATTTFDGAPVTSPTDQAIYPVDADPAITLAKDSDPSDATFATEGDVLTYVYTITNTSDVGFDQPITITDNRLDAPFTCYDPATSGALNVGQEVTCTAPYAVTQVDLDAGEVTNEAVATTVFAPGTANERPVTSNPAVKTVPAEEQPALTLSKIVSEAPDSALAGDEITFTLTATNSGNQTIADVTITDPMLPALTCTVDSVAAPTNVALAPGMELVCTGTYGVTQADVDAQSLVNTAGVRGSDPRGDTVSDTDSAEVTLAAPAPVLTVVKTVEPVPAEGAPAFEAPGDTVEFLITLRNEGNVTLDDIAVSDALPVSPATCSVATLAPGEEDTSCLVTYTVTQADVDGTSGDGFGSVLNSATASATTRTPTPEETTGRGEVTARGPDSAPALALQKTSDSEAIARAGEVVTYSYAVTNAGNVTLRAPISVSDDRIDAVTCPALPGAGLAPGATLICSADYVVTQADVDSGAVTNIATAFSDEAPAPATPGEETATLTIPVTAAPALVLEKLASETEEVTVGTVIEYSYRVTNTGNQTLTGVTVTDLHSSAAGTVALTLAGDALDTDAAPTGDSTDAGEDATWDSLAPGDTVLFTAQYRVTQADIDAQEPLTNTASVTAESPDATPLTQERTVSVTVAAPAPALEIEKMASETEGVAVGTVIDYSYRVTNTGNQTLRRVALTDQHTSAAGTVALSLAGDALETDAAPEGDSTDAGEDAAWDILAPGDTAVFTAQYTVTQADIDAQDPLTNTVTAIGTDPDGAPVTGEDTIAVSVQAAAPAIEALKVLDDSGLSAPPVAGETAGFDITVINQGNVSLRNVTLIENMRRNDGTSVDLPAPVLTGGDTGEAGVMLPGEAWTYRVDYVLTQADLDAGGLSNSVTARAQDSSDDLVLDKSDDGIDGNGDDNPALVPITPAPELLAEKALTTPASAVGQVAEFTITLTNAGNVTLTEVAITEERLTRLDGTLVDPAPVPVFAGATLGSGADTLLPGEVATYTVTHRLTQADVDAGGIANSLRAQATPPVGSPISDRPDAPAVNEVPSAPALSLAKDFAPDAPASVDAVGAEVPFVFTLTNTGNVTLTGTPAVDDPLLAERGVSPLCAPLPAEGLAPGATSTCAATLVVTQEDIDAGLISNTATATLDGTVSDPSTAVITATQRPALTLDKIAPDMPSEDFVTGAEAVYSFVTTNTGNVTITDPVRVVDTLIAPEDMICPAFPDAGLAPGDTYTCTATYAVTATDVDLGSVTNVAFATDGNTPSELDDAIIPNEGVPALSIDKIAEVTEFAAVGETVPFTFVVTNSGTRAFVNPVTVSDTLVGEIACFTPTEADPDLVAGESVTCTASVTVTQEDLDRGFIQNEAFARTTFGADATVVLSQPDLVRVDGSLTPALEIAKTAAPLPVTGVGHDLTFTVTVTNSGNQTLTNVVAQDPLIAGFLCRSDSLAPGEQLVCAGDYTVRQSDIDGGSLVNTATVRAVDPQGGAVTDEVVLPVDLPEGVPGLSLVKTANPSPFGGVGSTLTYGFAVENTGNVSLTGLTVRDPLRPEYACAIGVLAPGEVDRSCGLSLTVTQAMVDAGSQDNSATVTGLGPDGTPVSASDAITTRGPVQVPSLEATKVLVPGTVSAEGRPVRYRLTVENTGNVTLTDVSITDVMTDGTGAPVALDAPFALLPGSDADADGALDVGETWVYTAQRTLTQDDLDNGGLTNQVTVAARDPNGAPVTDLSDDGIDTDGDRTGDGTVFTPADAPALTVIKSVAQTGSLAGDTVIFRIEATNTGNLALSDLSVSDSMTRADGTALVASPEALSVPASLAPGDVAIWQVSHELTQDDVDAGGIANIALVRGEAPDGTPVTDLSADEDLGDGNTTDDPTEITILPTPGLTVLKTVTEVGEAAGDPVAFEIAVTNSGSVTLTGITVTDVMSDLDGNGPRDLTPVFVSADGDTPSPQGTLRPGETAIYTATGTLTLADFDAGGVQNSAVARGDTPQGGAITDISDDDGVGIDDPTVAAIVPLPSFEITKEAGTPVNLFPTVEQVTFTITVMNTGNLTQTGIRVSDDLAAFLAPAEPLTEAYPPEISLSGFAGEPAPNARYDGVSDIVTMADGAELAPGETGTVTLTVVYSTASGQPGQPNTASVISDQLTTPTTAQVTVLTTDRDGDGIPDRLETGDRDGDGIPDAEDYDPTGYFYCEEDGRILTGGLVTVTGGGFTQTGVGTSGPITVVRDGSQGFYQFHVSAPGSYTLRFGYPSTGTPSTSRLPGGPLDATTLLPANPAALGSAVAGTSGVLIDFAAGANPFVQTFVFEAGDPFVINNNIPLMQCGGARDVVATKQADRRTAVFGETVNYTLTFRNDTLNDYVDTRITDRLPTGMVYTPGSAKVNGVAQDPVRGAGTLTWRTDLAANATATVTFAARVTRTGSFGPRTNRTWMDHATGRRLSNVAEATVEVEPEHVFDCSDIIGKVFHDRNGNGYQDGPGTLAEPIRRDDIVSGKGGKLSPEPQRPDLTEPGVPGVRLVTPDGTIITTDEFGRYSVPCAALPRDIGANFQLKLDTRSLPTGFRVTTENPRNIRVTAGKMTRLNFGVALGKLVKIDLAAAAFVPGQADAVGHLDTAVRGLVGQIAATPSYLRLTYTLAPGEDAALARARLRELEKDIRRAWRGRGTYRLEIERHIVRSSR